LSICGVIDVAEVVASSAWRLRWLREEATLDESWHRFVVSPGE